MPSVYLAGKVPKDVKEVNSYNDWREGFQEKCSELSDIKIEFLNPNQGDWSMPMNKYFGRDVEMIKKSDAIVMDGTVRMGAGTAQEILIAKYYNKPVILVCPKNSHYDRIIKTKNGESVHYQHPFLIETVDLIVRSFEQAAKALIEHFNKNKIINPKSIDLIEKSRLDYLKFIAPTGN